MKKQDDIVKKCVGCKDGVLNPKPNGIGKRPKPTQYLSPMNDDPRNVFVQRCVGCKKDQPTMETCFQCREDEIRRTTY